MSQLGQAAPDLRPAGQRRYKIRTGAKTASRAQEREYLARFERLARDPTLLLPEWRGEGAAPWRKVARDLEKVHQRHAAGKSVDRLARKRSLAGAYATALKVLEKGKIASFAQLPRPGGRPVKYVVRGKARNHHHAAVQNFEEPDVLMLGFLELARKRKAVFWALKDGLVGTPPGAPMPDGFPEALFGPAGIPLAPKTEDAVACRHAADGEWHVRATIEGVQESFRFCARCLEKVEDRLEAWVTRGHLGRARRPKADLHVDGSPWQPATEASRTALKGLLKDVDADTRSRARQYVDFSNREFLDWGHEELKRALDARTEGYLLVGKDLWLESYGEAVQTLLGTPEERRLAAAAFATVVPHVETSDATVGKLVAEAWSRDAAAVVARAADGALTEAAVRDLAGRDPADVVRRLGQYEEAQRRLAAYPRYDVAAAPPPLALALRAAEAWHGRGKAAALDLAQEAATDPTRKVAALAVARAAGDSKAIEWRYTPDEKQAADFLTPYCRRLMESAPEAFPDAVGMLCTALGVPEPVRQG